MSEKEQIIKDIKLYGEKLKIHDIDTKIKHMYSTERVVDILNKLIKQIQEKEYK